MPIRWSPGCNCCEEPSLPICNPFGQPPVDFTTVNCTVTASWTGCPAPADPVEQIPCPNANVSNYVLPDRIGIVGATYGAWYNSAFNQFDPPTLVGCLGLFQLGNWAYDSILQRPRLYVSLLCGQVGGSSTHVIQIFRDNTSNPTGFDVWWRDDYPRDQVLPLDTPLVIPPDPTFTDPGHECLPDGDAIVTFSLK